MTVQMTVRIPDALAEFVDSEVAAGAKSRAEVIARALRREARRKRAEQDAAIYAAMPEDEDEARWAEWASRNASKVWADLD
ncbi:MAG: antitoxin [Microlunatus sp.]